jgi:hypothetical protein
VCLNDEEKGQIGGSNVVWDGGSADSTAQPTCGFAGTPPFAIVHAVPGFIWEMSGKYIFEVLVDTTHAEVRGTNGASIIPLTDPRARR